MLQFWGDGSQQAKDLVSAIRVRSTENFNWTFIFILAVVFYIYWSEIHKKNTEMFYYHAADYIATERKICLEDAQEYDAISLQISGEKLLEVFENGRTEEVSESDSEQ